MNEGLRHLRKVFSLFFFSVRYESYSARITVVNGRQIIVLKLGKYMHCYNMCTVIKTKLLEFFKLPLRVACLLLRIAGLN